MSVSCSIFEDDDGTLRFFVHGVETDALHFAKFLFEECMLLERRHIANLELACAERDAAMTRCAVLEIENEELFERLRDYETEDTKP